MRSETALIQTIGRAARHVDGKVIMYADKMTDAMRNAIDETNRRRAKQVAFNTEHGITPRGVQKRIKDIIDGVYDADATPQELKAAQTVAEYKLMDDKALTRKIKKLEKEMLDAAKNLEFEKAAELRDHLRELKQVLFGVEEHDS